ncbi:M48 family metallopeptidase [Oceanicella sp. SM1341]|uniref:M48 family metallopeptidase n=1 Tax=Oceanicella sp. SM1341 TaxID=1548889 RepID=UPI000E4C261C|nr:M48 family metallopeptidase [Oceanicella sp. SM1341]
MPISKADLKALRHPSENGRFLLTLFVLIPVAVLTAALVIGTMGVVLLIVPVTLFFLWFSLRLYTAWHINNSVQVTERAFPEAHAAIREAQELFGYHGRVEAFVIQEGSYNASLLPLLSHKVLILNAELMKPGNSDRELRFIVGRFVGSLASRHYRFAWFEAFLNGVEKLVVLNLLLTPYERAVKLSGDQMGLYMIDGDLRSGVTAMMKMILGSDVVDRADVGSFLAQEAKGGGFFGWLVRAMSDFPHHTTRVANLIRFAEARYPQEAERFRAAAPAPRAGAMAAE